MKDDLPIIKRIIKSLYLYKKKIILIFLTMLMASVINFIIPLTYKQLMDEGLLKNNFVVVVKFALIGLLLFILERLINQVQISLIAYINNMYQYRWTSISMRKIMKLKLNYLNEKNFTEIMNNITMDVAGISRITDQSFVYRIFNIFKILGGAVGLITIDYRLCIIILIFIPLRYVITNYFTKIRKEIHMKYMKHSSEFSGWYGDRMAGIKEVKLGGIENLIMKQFADLQRNLIKIDIKAEKTDNLCMIIESILFEVIIKSIYIFGGLYVIQRTFTLGGLFAFVSYSMSVISPISSLINIKYDFMKILLAGKRLFKFLDEGCEGEISDSKQLENIELKNKISFKNVTYFYNQDKKVLDDISFEIEKGQKVGIVGLNGSGKTTILNILLRLCEPQSGQVYMDDYDLKDIKLKELRKIMSFVSQDFYIFKATIKDNITLFSKRDDNDIKHAANISCAHEFIDKFPDSYNKVLGTRGSGLSGGEKQRLALTRALSRSSKILLLDEATSSIDLKNESMINEMLIKNLKDHTIIMVTHRPYILEKLDKIIVLDCGIISGIGLHSQLINENEKYARIINREISSN